VNYVNNEPIGIIKFFCENQGSYEGETDTMSAYGKGKMTLLDGSIYQGAWNEDKPHGNGYHKLPDGSIY